MNYRSLQFVCFLIAMLLSCGEIGLAQGVSPLTCVGTAAVPPFSRSEGITQLMSDLIIRCFGGTPTAAGAVIPTTTLQLSLNTNVSSRVLGHPWTEALLFLDEPGWNPVNLVQAPCQLPGGGCLNLGNGEGGPTATNPNYYIGQGTGANVNIYQGRLAPGRTDSIIFDNIPFDPPGTNGERILRIGNIRAYVAALGDGSIPLPVIATLTSSGPVTIPMQIFQPIVGFLQRSVATTVLPNGLPPMFSPCTPQNLELAANSAATGTSQFAVRFSELLPYSLRRRSAAEFVGDETSPPPVSQNMFLPQLHTETGFFNRFFPDLGIQGNLAAAGLADHGTRLVARFNGVPPGVKIFTKAAMTFPQAFGHQTVIRLIQTDVNGAGPFAPIPASSSGLAQIPITGLRSAIAVFEVLDAGASVFDQVNIPFYVAYNGVPELGSVTVNLGLGPLSTAFAASGFDAPIPRFVDTSTALIAFEFSVGGCAAAPAVTSQMHVTLGEFRPSGGQVAQDVIVKNVGVNPAANPIWLVLDSLSSNTSLVNRAGFTSAALPAGSPFVGAGSSGSLLPGQVARFVLRFQKPVSGTITYTPRVLAGPFPR